MLSSWLSDRFKHRSGFIILNTLICIVGLSLTAFASKNEVRYLGEHLVSAIYVCPRVYLGQGTFLTNIGNGGAAPGILAYVSKFTGDRPYYLT
jgi:MFS family permease